MSTDPKKDVIYIDIDDDITSVIEKVKTSKTSIVALVPPKRIGVLQSAVNLKLLQRAATSVKKRVVLITNDHALSGLAAGLSLPVAKNLQSKPEIPSITAMKLDEEEVINGEELPVGELARTAEAPSFDSTDDAVETIDMPDDAVLSAPFAAKKAAARAPKRGSKIPDFDSFRKKLFIFGGLGVLALIFLVWAIFFAGKATVAITAKTNVVSINKPLQLRPDAKLDAAQGIVPAIVKETKKAASVDFTATGKKEVGEKATGTVSFENSEGSAANISAGTQVVTSSGLGFVTNSAVTVPKATLTFGNECGADHLCPGTATVGITAINGGSKYNGASGSVSGSFDGASGELTGATGGGTDKTVTVVSQADIEKAKEQLQAQKADAVKKDLLKQFDDNVVVIQESFEAEPAEPTSSPALDQEATTAKLTAETTYRLVGIARSDLRGVYDTFTKSQISGEKNQKIYESGDESTTFAQFEKKDGVYNVRAQATAQVGPNIDDKALAKQLIGKRAGEIQQQIETIQGVEDVTVKFSPFWVTKAPNNADKITIKFIVQHDEN